MPLILDVGLHFYLGQLFMTSKPLKCKFAARIFFIHDYKHESNGD